MKTRKILVVVLAALMMLTMVACAAKEPAKKLLTVEGVSGVTEFNSDGYKKLTEKEATLTNTKKDGTTVETKVKGVLLKDVLTQLGVTNYTSVTVVGADDFKKDFEKAIVESDLTYLTSTVDGAAGQIIIAGGQATGYSIKDTVKIIVNP